MVYICLYICRYRYTDVDIDIDIDIAIQVNKVTYLQYLRRNKWE